MSLITYIYLVSRIGGVIQVLPIHLHPVHTDNLYLNRAYKLISTSEGSPVICSSLLPYHAAS